MGGGGAAPVAGTAPAPRRAFWLGLLRRYGPLVGLLAAALGLRVFKLGEVPGQLIGDEIWYVQDARVILGLPVLRHHLAKEALSGLDPNTEHPPLAKLIMAGSMKLLGDTEIAWRLPSVVLGLLGIWLLFEIVRALGGTRDQAGFAAFLLAFDNLTFIHGRIAMLDIYVVTFMLLGTWLYLRSFFELAGLAFGLAALCKLTGVLGLGSLVLYEALLHRRQWRTPDWRAIGRRASTLVFCGGFLVLGLGLLDCLFTEFRSPFAHFYSMFHYHAGLTHTGPSTGAESTPFQWWLNSGAMDYFVWTVNEGATSRRILFRAAMNDYLIIGAPLALLYATQRAWQARSRLGAFAIASVVATFGPMFLIWVIFSRTSYIFYMLPSVPAMACALSLGAFALPRSIRWGYAALILYAFFFGFPFKYF